MATCRDQKIGSQTVGRPTALNSLCSSWICRRTMSSRKALCHGVSDVSMGRVTSSRTSAFFRGSKRILPFRTRNLPRFDSAHRSEYLEPVEKAVAALTTISDIRHSAPSTGFCATTHSPSNMDSSYPYSNSSCITNWPDVRSSASPPSMASISFVVLRLNTPSSQL